MNNFINKTYHFPSPAKLNLFLHIVGQRDDGYHELQTLFQFLDHNDTISITVNNSAKISLLTPIKGVNNDDNLIVKAACLLQKKAINRNRTFSLGAEISIKKILPMGGGLGGGSSNAATILIALNQLWKTNFSLEDLAKLGIALGADVPVFIHGFAAFAQGVGEKLTPIQPEECWYLVTKPNCSISTVSVFQSPDLPRNTPKLSTDNNVALWRGELFHNDCETMVIKHYPEVANLLAWLVEYVPSRMTGTGACVFSPFSSQKQARELQTKLPTGVSSFVAQGLNISPLITVMEQLITE